MQCVEVTLEKVGLDHSILPCIFLSHQAKMAYLYVCWITIYAKNAPQRS